MKKSIPVVMALLLSGCAVQYSPYIPRTEYIDSPDMGVVSSAQVGDHMLTKGVLIEQEVLHLKMPVSGFHYSIQPGMLPKVGIDMGEQFFSPIGVTKSPLADMFQLVSVRDSNPSQICVVTVMAQRSCYDAYFEIKNITSARDASFQQTLIYSGRVGDKINIGYREFSANTARPAFNNDVEYDLSTSRKIGYKGAELEVIDADNTGITYKVIRSFR